MTRIAAIVLALGMAGCFGWRKGADAMDGMGAGVTLDQHGERDGAAVHGVVGAGGFYAALELAGATDLRRTDDPRSYRGGGMDFSLRASPLGLLATEHRLERYLDFGAEVGVGFQVIDADRIAGTGRAWVGGWTELGTFSASDGYVAVTGNIRMIDAGEPWLDTPTQFTIGLAWRSRGPSSERRYDIHD